MAIKRTSTCFNLKKENFESLQSLDKWWITPSLYWQLAKQHIPSPTHIPFGQLVWYDNVNDAMTFAICACLPPSVQMSIWVVCLPMYDLIYPMRIVWRHFLWSKVPLEDVYNRTVVLNNLLVVEQWNLLCFFGEDMPFNRKHGLKSPLHQKQQEKYGIFEAVRSTMV